MLETFWKREDGKTSWDDEEVAFVPVYGTIVDWTLINGTVALASKGVFPPAIILQMTWKRNSVAFTYFASPDYDVDLKYCKEHNIAVDIRCPFGGGVAWVDKGAPATVIVLNRDHPQCPPTLEEMYKRVFTKVAKDIGEFYGLKTRFKPLNDIEVMCDDGKWRKLSLGSGLQNDKGVGGGFSIQLTPIDWNFVDKIITPPPEKFADKETKTLRDRSTNLKEMIGREVSLEEFQELAAKTVSEEFKVTPISTKVDWEKIPEYQMAKSFLTSDAFFYNRAERVRFADTPIVEGVGKGEARVKIPQGPFVRAVVLLKDHKLYNILITGSLHASPIIPESPIDVLERELKGVPADEKTILERVKKVFSTAGYEVLNITPEQFTELIMRAVKTAKGKK
jgi:lipoate-protein ligase A